MLHRLSQSKKIRDIVLQNHTDEDIVELILKLAQFEFELKILFRQLIQDKDKTWNFDKQECEYYMNETSEFFAGNRNVGRQYVD